jgi:hypothetical protein
MVPMCDQPALNILPDLGSDVSCARRKSDSRVGEMKAVDFIFRLCARI